MVEERRERADAARNRRAILEAAEELLRRHPPDQVSVERVAAAAGVGKGTVFHRFGSRVGLMQELMTERARALEKSVSDGPPPLGPGAPASERLVAFLDAVVTTAARNAGLIAAHEHAMLTSKHGAEPPMANPIYAFWHGHVSSLITEARPDTDAELIAHILLRTLHTEPVGNLLRAGETPRVTAALAELAAGLLKNAPNPDDGDATNPVGGDAAKPVGGNAANSDGGDAANRDGGDAAKPDGGDTAKPDGDVEA